ncbi:MAG: 50S ribosome-binding GTPase, partial [Synergistaceae bacterium]|nr:50S ribosome-binding GTPase [Synergistaceae bacterium]
MNTENTLNELKINESGVVLSVGGEGSLRQHLLDMGIIPGAEVKMIRLAPMGDPLEIRIHDYELTLRQADAERIKIRLLSNIETENRKPQAPKISRIEHPGLGEEGKYHANDKNEPLPDGTVLTFALVGNQNSGKTTLFNQLTGAKQRIGNFPGVTVSRKDGAIKGHPDTLITDLPGIYSMSPYSGEELISRHFVLYEKPKAIINILDATNIERNLYLTIQLLEMQIPTVVALNMMDELSGNGGTIDINAMEALLGVPVIPISALKNEGVDELVNHAVHIARYQEKPKRYDFCDEDDNGGAVHRCIHAISHLIQDHAERAGIPLRFAASKVIENDPLVLDKLQLEQNEKEMLEHIIIQMENERGLDRNAAMADMRFNFIEKVCARSVVKPKESKE